MKQWYVLGLIGLLFTACTSSGVKDKASKTSGDDAKDVAEQVIEKLSKEEFKSKMAEKTDAYLIDVRTPDEYKNGTIGEAQNINFYDSDFEQQISNLDRNKPVFVFCRSGNRSGQSLVVFKNLGFQEVYDLKGGYMGWK